MTPIALPTIRRSPLTRGTTDTLLAVDIGPSHIPLVKAYDEVADFIVWRYPGEVAEFKP